MLLGRENLIFYATSSFNETFFSFSLFRNDAPETRRTDGEKRRANWEIYRGQKEAEFAKKKKGEAATDCPLMQKKITATGVPLVAS